MEKENDVTIVASIGTFSEGIDVLNLHNIYVVETTKARIIVSQILGRGMRLMTGKDLVMVIDFSDDYVYGSDQYQKKNYLIRHAEERRSLYKLRSFPYKVYKVVL